VELKISKFSDKNPLVYLKIRFQSVSPF